MSDCPRRISCSLRSNRFSGWPERRGDVAIALPPPGRRQPTTGDRDSGTRCRVEVGGDVKEIDGGALSPKAVRHIVLVHGFFKKAVTWQLFPRNPMDGIELPRVTKKPPRVLEQGVAKKLLECTHGPRLYPLSCLGSQLVRAAGNRSQRPHRRIDEESGARRREPSLASTYSRQRVTEQGRPTLTVASARTLVSPSTRTRSKRTNSPRRRSGMTQWWT
jgi:hypothetical protein